MNDHESKAGEIIFCHQTQFKRDTELLPQIAFASTFDFLIKQSTGFELRTTTRFGVCSSSTSGNKRCSTHGFLLFAAGNKSTKYCSSASQSRVWRGSRWSLWKTVLEHNKGIGWTQGLFQQSITWDPWLTRVTQDSCAKKQSSQASSILQRFGSATALQVSDIEIKEWDKQLQSST